MIENSAGWRYIQSTDSPADYPTVSAHNAGKFQDLKSIVGGLDTELDGKAPLSHTHSTSQVTGLDAALQGKAPLSTLNTRVPAGLALRLDTTVGTRVFAGNTMIYGDTGLRDVSGLISDYESGVAVYQRIGNVCYLLLKNVKLTSTYSAIRIPNAKTAYTNFEQLSYNSDANEVSWGRFAAQWNSYPAIWPGAAGTPIFVNASWPTRDGWPGSLPGLPV